MKNRPKMNENDGKAARPGALEQFGEALERPQAADDLACRRRSLYSWCSAPGAESTRMVQELNDQHFKPPLSSKLLEALKTLGDEALQGPGGQGAQPNSWCCSPAISSSAVAEWLTPR